MSPSNFDEALEHCLQRLQTGATIEACLRAYPHYAVDLRPLLEMAVGVTQLSFAPQDGAARLRGQEQMLAALHWQTRRSGVWNAVAIAVQRALHAPRVSLKSGFTLVGLMLALSAAIAAMLWFQQKLTALTQPDADTVTPGLTLQPLASPTLTETLTPPLSGIASATPVPPTPAPLFTAHAPYPPAGSATSAPLPTPTRTRMPFPSATATLDSYPPAATATALPASTEAPPSTPIPPSPFPTLMPCEIGCATATPTPTWWITPTPPPTPTRLTPVPTMPPPSLEATLTPTETPTPTDTPEPLITPTPSPTFTTTPTP